MQTITIENINQDIKNIRINLSIVGPSQTNTLLSNIWVSDEGNKNYYFLG